MKSLKKILGIVAVVLIVGGCGGGGGGDNPSNSDTNITNGNSGGGGNNQSKRPLAPKLVSVSSATKGTAYVEWLPSLSERNESITYRIYASTKKDFSTSSTALKLETKNHEGEITGLEGGKEYYIRVAATNSKGSANSLALPVKISSVEIKKMSGVNLVVQKKSQIKKVDENSVVLSEDVNVGDYIIGDVEHPYLRKVLSVNKSGGVITAQTEPASLGHVYSDIEFSFSHKMEDPQNTPQSKTKIIANNLKRSSFTWASGSSLSSTKETSIKQRSNKIVFGENIAVNKGEYFIVNTPTAISVNKGDHLKYKLDIKQIKKNYSSYSSYMYNEIKECEAVGGTLEEESWGIDNCLNIPVKPCAIGYSIKDLEDIGSLNKPKIVSENGNYYIDWTPDGTNIDPIKGGKYSLSMKLKIGVGDCSEYNIIRTQKLKEILIAAGDDLPTKVTFAYKKPYKFTTSDNSVVFENKLTADFSPSIILNGKLLDKKYTEASAKLHAIFSFKDLATLKAKLDAKHTFDPIPVYTKKFVKVVMAGLVPIYFSGQLKFMAVANVDSNAKIDAVLDSGMTFTLDYGMHYDGKSWNPIKSAKSTYHIKLEAEGDTETTFTIKLVPDFHIEVYSLAAAHLLVEPYLFTNVGVKGSVMANKDSSNHDYFDADIGFSKLNAGGGVDLFMYAGAAWDTRFKSLRWPEDAHYAKIGGASFMNPKHRKLLREYYNKTRKYRKFTPVDKRVIASIPEIKGVVFYSAKPPKGIDSRAIKVVLRHTDIRNQLADIIGPEYPITFKNWDLVGVITNNAKILGPPKREETTTWWEYLLYIDTDTIWVLPQADKNGNYTDIVVKCVAHSSLGPWARQYMKLNIDQGVAVSSDFMPPYWKKRYGLSDEKSDEDGDGVSNLDEFKAGTDPQNEDSDDDGFKDGEEIAQGTNPNDKNDYPSFHNTPPVAKAGEDKTIQKGETVTLDATKSSDKEDDIDSLEFVWKEGDKELGRSKLLLILDLSVGTHTITLTVTDPRGASSSDEVVIKVVDNTPPPSISKLKKTGQTKSYDQDGNEVTDNSIKDDGYYRAGVDPQYRRDPNNDDIVIDDITKLQWQDDERVETVKKPWLTQENYDKCRGQNGQTQDDSACFDTSGDTATTYCKDLILGNYDDWRLPTRKELKSIVDYGRYDPAIDPIFNHTSSDNYWSSTTLANDHDHAWFVGYWDGDDNGNNKDNSNFVRCVRDGE